MIVVGLTGSIGMGKSTVARYCRQMGIPVEHADAVVHALMAPGGKAFFQVAEAFPEVMRNGVIDRGRLGTLVFADTEALRRLESIVHPLVAAERERFLKRVRARRCRIAVLDIPLLFEKGLESVVETIISVSAPEFVQRARVLSRPGMSMEKFRRILAAQMPDAEKRRRSDYVIRSGGSKSATLRQLRRIMDEIGSQSGHPRRRHARNRSRHRNNRP